MTTSFSKKLIEVALPLEAINRESAREKSIRHGHPSTLHNWWARRPLAACRGVLFATLVDDPSSHPERFSTEQAQEKERQRLFGIIEELVRWENIHNEAVLSEAREEIRKSTAGNPPPLLDPFCGGGSIPLEGERLGLDVYASDLNPVAVLITKALAEIPPRFSSQRPVNPDSRKGLDRTRHRRGAEGLSEDVRYYGTWMRQHAEKLIGRLYPKVALSQKNGGREAAAIAWIWARTLRCPNPACGGQMPIVRSFSLSTKKGNPAWIHPIVDKVHKSVSFKVLHNSDGPPQGTKQRRKSRCLICNTDNITDAVLREQSKKYGIRHQLMAVIAEGERSAAYFGPETVQHIDIEKPSAEWLNQSLPDNARWFSPPLYGLSTYRDLFTSRQLVALTTFADLVEHARHQVELDAATSGMPHDDRPLTEGGVGAKAYAEAVATYLAFAVDRSANYWSSLTPWGGGFIVQTFGRQALPMVWDFAEANPFSDSTGNWNGAIDWITGCLDVSVPAIGNASVKQLDATAAINGAVKPLIFTDPPYYDNIGYADLSDFFYLWMRRTLGRIYPQVFSTVLTPKEQELIASPCRHGGDKLKAERFFEEGLGKAFDRIRSNQHPDYPVALYYAFKQAESDDNDEEASGETFASTGWETMLEGLIKSQFGISGTWPLRTERDQGLKTGTNVLATSIVLVCRTRPTDAPLATRREFLTALKKDLPDALRKLKQGNIAPVDLAQAAIGPGMAVFSNYSKVLESDGTPMTVRTALALINQMLDEVLAEQESEFDPDTRWALAWFEQSGMEEGIYGTAETLSKAKNTSVRGLVDAGIVKSGAGKVRLLKRTELRSDWDPARDQRLTIWEITQHLIRALEQEGEPGAASLLRRLGSLGEVARDLAYRQFNLCERKKWAQEALAYNSLVVAWPEIARLSKSTPSRDQQARLSL